MIDDNQITLVIEGFPEDDGRVRFAAFISELQSLNSTISKLDRAANDGHAATYFRIAELSYTSPARIVLEPQPMEQGGPLIGHLIIESLGRVANAFENGGDLLSLDTDLLENIRNLARPVGNNVKSAVLLFDGREFALTQKIATQVDDALAVDDECEGALEGMLEQINVHMGANTFHIYPDVGPRKVTCNFAAHLYDDAVSSVGKRVEVLGTLRYRARAQFPHQIVVREIDAYEPLSDLPDWEDLRGLAPDATGGLSSEEFVRELRNGWR